MADWSASSVPKTGADSIWCAWLAAGRVRCELANPPTRALAFAWIRERLFRAQGPVLAAFDFPLGYPRGAGHWLAMWRSIAAAVEDAPDNRNNRFAAAPRLCRAFWGKPGGERKPPAQTHGLPEMRLADAWVRGPQSPWKLYGIGSAGSQSLVGIPYLLRLREDPELAARVRVWPFETGLRAPREPDIVLAEAWPSLLRPRPRPSEPKDRAQVRTLAHWLRRMDRAALLAALFEGPCASLTRGDRQAIETEEGWILGLK